MSDRKRRTQSADETRESTEASTEGAADERAEALAILTEWQRQGDAKEKEKDAKLEMQRRQDETLKTPLTIVKEDVLPKPVQRVSKLSGAFAAAAGIVAARKRSQSVAVAASNSKETENENKSPKKH